jgi:hypothetical protein
MSQPLTVAHRSGQLAYPTWAAHTTHCPDLLVDGSCRCEGSGQAGQGMRGPLLYLQYGGATDHIWTEWATLCRIKAYILTEWGTIGRITGPRQSFQPYRTRYKQT